MIQENIIYGILLSLFAGLSTSLGASIIFFIKKPSRNTINLIMGFSAGVMISISIFELIPSSMNELGLLNTSIAFTIGIVAVMLIDFLLPHDYEYEHGFRADEEIIWDEFEKFERRRHQRGQFHQKGGRHRREKFQKHKMMRTGNFIVIGIAIHNFPEGFVTLSGSLQSLELGLLLALAIAFHNIPEGLSIAIPIMAATDDKPKAFKLAFLSGLAEPIGAIVGALILYPFLDTILVDLTLAFVAGIMIFISIDELLPTAHQNCGDSDNHHSITVGILLGMILMVATILVLD